MSTSDHEPEPEYHQISMEELQQHGFHVEDDEPTPEEDHKDEHPTPDHPTGRIGP